MLKRALVSMVSERVALAGSRHRPRYCHAQPTSLLRMRYLMAYNTQGIQLLPSSPTSYAPVDPPDREYSGTRNTRDASIRRKRNQAHQCSPRAIFAETMGTMSVLMFGPLPRLPCELRKELGALSLSEVAQRHSAEALGGEQKLGHRKRS